MGIFEIVIFVSAAVIFIILVRRFPDTAESLPGATIRLPKFGPTLSPLKHSFKALKNLMPKRHHNPQSPHQTPDATDVTASIIIKQQFEPGSSPDDLDRMPHDLKSTLMEAEKLFAGENFVDAEKFYLKAAAREPKCVTAYYRLGSIYMNRKDGLDDAEAAFQQAHKFEADNGFVLNNLGLVNFHKGLFNEAVGFYEQAIIADGSLAVRHANLGLAYLSLRHYAKAVRALSRAWSLDPHNQEFKQLLDDAKARERRQRTIRH